MFFARPIPQKHGRKNDVVETNGEIIRGKRDALSLTFSRFRRNASFPIVLRQTMEDIRFALKSTIDITIEDAFV